MNLDYIIVGKGIAGSVLAKMLLQRKKKIVVIDDPSLSQASRIAAGIINPVVFKRLTKSWRVDEALPAAIDFYNSIGLEFNEKIYFETPIVRLFNDETEKELWNKKSITDVAKYIYQQNTKDQEGQYGCGEVKHSGYLDTSLFLNLIEQQLKSRKSLIEERFDFKELEVGGDNVRYKGLISKKIIFSEGFRVIENPFLKWLPLKPAKGELITIRAKNLNFKKIMNKGVFILPLGDDLFKVGATYNWENVNELPTDVAKKELINKLNSMLNVPYEIIIHEAGVRPAVMDRKPLLGVHPEYSSIGVFNGMGTKGVMLAPYYSKLFIDFMELDISLDKEVDVKRFWNQTTKINE